ncbi:MAG: response regulator [Thermodesulfobacteriota bacterium]
MEATRQIKTELPSVRVVVLSMYQDKQSARIMIEAGADAFLTKSVSCAELLQTIRG